ncbi:MAG: NADH-quinone oxidoreductase subunit N [Desulfovibrionaceae bacterium]|nr:NADH-quinone oxidoreductase subunit N [Desulfovibrionaceae bacterium]MBF0512515.1 NADH-quinone oxidoreductase subunit N [Desulfovibrionaceae bacterium]
MKAVLFLSEFYQLGLVLALLAASVAGQEEDRDPVWLPFVAWLGAAVAFGNLGARGMMFWDAYKVDALSQFFKLAISVGFAIAVTNAIRQPLLERAKRADYFMLMSFSALGLMLLSSCVELITIYVALELASYALYALIPLRAQDKRAAEAAIKYILFGAMVTALSLYGLSYIINGQHTTYIAELANKPWSVAASPMAVIGLTLFLAGFFYKLAMFPFHFWCPDVYQGTSNETAAYVATLPKLGAVVILVRLASILKPGLEITTILAVLGAASMTFGNLAALAQTDLKRLLGYSSVAHAGYVMLGLVSGTGIGMAAAAFYSLIYILMNLTCFWVICRIAKNGENVSLADLGGLYKKAPGLAFILAVSAFALVGLPPTAGFTGKLFLLSSAWDHGYNWLVIVAVLNTAISIYYYLNMVRHAYTTEAATEEPATAVPAYSMAFGAGLSAVLLLLGILPGPVYDLAVRAGLQILP